MGVRGTWERVAPPGSGARRGAPFGLAAIAGAAFGALAVAAFTGDDDPAFAAPAPGFGVAAAALPAPPPGIGEMPLPPRPELQAQTVHRAPGPDPLTICFADHGVNPRPQSGRWPRDERPSATELRRAIAACLDRSPALPPFPEKRRGG